MAKLHKVSMFVLDANEEYESVENLIEYAFDRTEASAHHIEAQTSQFPWYDDIVLNYCSATKQDYEDFMDVTERRRLQMTRAVEKKHKDIKSSVKNIMESLGLPTSDEDVIEFLKQAESVTEFYMGEDNANS